MSIDARARGLATGILMWTISACVNAQVRAPGPTVPDPGRTIDTRTAVVSAGARKSADVRRVCRGSRPGGWIAVDYVADSTTCGGSAGRRVRYPVAIIVSHRDAVIGESLEVCAAEGVPRGWIRDRDVADDPRCPHEQPSTRATVMVIRRVR